MEKPGPAFREDFDRYPILKTGLGADDLSEGTLQNADLRL